MPTEQIKALAASISTGVQPTATSATNPGTPTQTLIYPAIPGTTYPNFKDNTGTAITVPTSVSGNPVISAFLVVTGAVTQLIYTPVAINLTDYAKVTDTVVTAAASTGNDGSTLLGQTSTGNFVFFNNTPVGTGKQVQLDFKASTTDDIIVHVIRLVAGNTYKTVQSATVTGIVVGQNTKTINLDTIAGDFCGVQPGSNKVWYNSFGTTTYFSSSAGISGSGTAFASATGVIGVKFTSAVLTVKDAVTPLPAQVSANSASILANSASVTDLQTRMGNVEAGALLATTYGNDGSSLPSTSGSNFTFFQQNNPVLADGTLSEVTLTLGSSAAGVKVHIVRPFGSQFKSMSSVVLSGIVAGTKTYVISMAIKAGDFVAIWLPANGIKYNSAGAGNYNYLSGSEVSTSGSTFGTSPGTMGIAFKVSQTALGLATQANNNISGLSLLPVRIGTTFKTDLFTSISTDWTNTGTWTVSGGGLQSTSAGIGNAILLNKNYNILRRKTRIFLTMQADTNFAIGYKPQETTYLVAGTIAAVDAVNSKIRFYETWSGSAAFPSVRVEATIPAIVAGRVYILELEKLYRTNKLRLTDTVTAVTTELVTSSTQDSLGTANEVYGGGFGHDNPVLMHISGTTPIVTRFDVNTDKVRPKLFLLGDSITEEYGATVGSGYSRLLATALNDNCVISGRGGGIIDAVINKITTEAAFLLPQYVMVTIGSNGNNTLTKLQSLVSQIKAIGAIPIINCIPANNKTGSAAHVTANAQILSLGELSTRFDIATGLGNDPTAAPNPSLFIADLLHPNNAGHQAMFNRFKIDVPDIFI
ncbi:hypothetical protein ACRQ5D_10925 [Mucilaginibacter sp. P25]|uniref:hypothetical protein n=1 Tax=Mucilaginibacter sp. P25 TaxID=3423945 RepID=UPI003D7B1EAE